VPELIQKNLTKDNIVREVTAIIPEGKARQRMLQDLREIQDKLRDSGHAEAPTHRAAREILSFF
jgi:lipid A disaccharide synthetase